MSNTAAVAADSNLPPGPDGEIVSGEIGRARHLQAGACKPAPLIHMTTMRLKPQTDITNMHLAENADLPIVRLSGIDRGGTMAAIEGPFRHGCLRNPEEVH